MARKRKAKENDFIVSFVLIALFWPILLFFWIVKIIWKAWQTRPCEMCGNQIRKIAYNWVIDGKRKRVCPHCNQRLEREQSRRAF